MTDEQIFFFINGHHTPFFDQLMYLLTLKLVWVPVYVALLYAVWRNYSWRGALGVLVMVGIGMLFTDCFNSQLLRPWIGRLRPSNPDNPIAPLVHIVNGRHGNGCGFPSAHSANMWMLTFVIWHWLREKWLTVAMSLLTVAICYSRVYLGFHYPGDILGGFVLALLVVLLLSWLHRRFLHFKPIVAPRHTWVPVAVIITTLLCFVIVAFFYVHTINVSDFHPLTATPSVLRS